MTNPLDYGEGKSRQKEAEDSAILFSFLFPMVILFIVFIVALVLIKVYG